MAEVVVRWLYEKRRWMPGGSVLATTMEKRVECRCPGVRRLGASGRGDD